MASFGVEFKEEEYSRALDEYWHRVNESQVFVMNDYLILVQ